MEYFKIKLSDYYNGINDNAILEGYVSSTTTKKPRPAILLCAGGGYHFVSENEQEPVVFNLLTLNVNVFSLTYTVAGQGNTYPDALREVAAAFDFIYNNAEKYRTDNSLIGIMGFSAGGHLAAHYSNRYNIPEISEVIKNPIKPAFSVLCYPVVSANPLYYHRNSFVNLLGHNPSEKEIDEFSTDKMVSEDTPPTFIWTTAEDKLVPPVNSILYAEKLSLFGVPFALHIYPTGTHGLSVVNETVPYKETKVINPPDYHNAVWIEELKHFIRSLVYRG